MKKKLLLTIVSMFLVLTLAACGEKSKEDVIGALDEKVKDMSGYKVNATMTLKAGTTAQKYNVEVWYNKPTYYRVALSNSKKNQSQMILRNNEGVFVLTPALNKSYRFQSDWPMNSSQVYLFESLVKDITKDKNAKFKKLDKSYVFETKTNYNNNDSLPSQVISFNKRTLAPESVKIKDVEGKVLVSVVFNTMKFDAKFDKNAFDTKKNMTSAKLKPSEVVKNETPFSIKYPLVNGMDLIEEKQVSSEDGERVVLTYGGEKNFTLVEEKAVVREASTTMSMSGEPVDLGFAVGVLNGNMLTWTHEGVDYTLASDELSASEMVNVARSVQGQAMK
jgi:outer membrane lipoprotein-sorting protein